LASEAARAFFFFAAAISFLSSRMNTEGSWLLDIALIKASSPCFSIRLRQAHSFIYRTLSLFYGRLLVIAQQLSFSTADHH
jgi:hypothetical protein